MRNAKHFVQLGLAALFMLAMSLPVFAGGGQQGGGAAPALKEIDKSKPVELVLWTTGSQQAARQQEVYDNFNALLAKRGYNATLKVNLYGSGEWRQKYQLQFASGEVFDMSYAATWLNFAQLAKRGSFMELDAIWPKYAPKNWSMQKQAAKDQATVDGHLYAIPTMQATYSAYGPVYRADLALNKGWDGKMTGIPDLEKYMDVIKANYPAVQPWVVGSGGAEMDDMWMYNRGRYPIQGATGGFLYLDPSQSSPKVLAFWEWPDMVNDFLPMMKRWADKGFYPKSALSDTEPDRFRNGKTAMRIHNVDSYEGEYRTAKNLGHTDWIIRYQNFVTDLSNLAFTQDAAVIPHSSKNFDRMLDLYDAITTDKEMFYNFFYGKEGMTYSITNEGGQDYVVPDPRNGLDWANWSNMWAARTTGIVLPSAGAPPDLLQIKKGYDDAIAKQSYSQKWRSFVPDTSSVETEFANCINVHLQYWWPLELGLNVGTTANALAEYKKAMEAAGVEKIKAALQTQVDAFAASHK